MRFRKLTIKGFRGFNEEQSILLDSDLVLIYGLNGSGKSSFTEALEWLFFGDISRQRLSRCKSEYQYENYLNNLFYTGPDHSFVEIEGTIAGKPIVIRKELTASGDLLYVDNKPVSSLQGLNLNLQNYFRPMLAQTEIKALVDSEQKDRWVQLSSILGQDDLTKLRESLVSLKNSKRDESYKKQDERRGAILNNMEEIPTLSLLVDPFKRLDEALMVKALSEFLGQDYKSLEELLTEVKLKEKNLLNGDLGKRIAEIKYKGNDELSTYTASLQADLTLLEDQAIKSTYGDHNHHQLNFFKYGLDLATIPECPFCLAQTLTEERVNSISTTLAAGKESQEAKSIFDDKKRTITETVNNFPIQISKFVPASHELKIISQKLIDIDENELALDVQKFDKKLADFATTAGNEAKNIANREFERIEKKYFHKQDSTPTGDQSLKTFLGSTATLISELVSEWDTLKTTIAAKIITPGELSKDEMMKWNAIEKSLTFLIESKAFIARHNLLTRVELLQQKLEVFEKAEVNRLLIKHANEIKEYYQKLNPGDHVQFSGIDVKGGARRQAKLKAEAYGKTVNPVTFFSEAHTNSLALSIYFPQRVDRNITWESLVLDDPVQSMDENHSDALIDILADIAEKKQTIILTHSRPFFRRLQARLGHKQPKVYSFFYDENKGPSIQLSDGETMDHLKTAEQHRKIGDPASLTIASQQLRQAIESVCFEFLLGKGLGFTTAKNVQGKGFSTLFARCEQLGLPPAETGKLKGLLDTSSGSSHAWSILDPTSGGIKSGAKHIEDIYNQYVN